MQSEKYKINLNILILTLRFAFLFFNYFFMSRKCSVCKRGSINSASRSHSNIATKKRQYINLQTKKLMVKKSKFAPLV